MNTAGVHVGVTVTQACAKIMGSLSVKMFTGAGSMQSLAEVCMCNFGQAAKYDFLPLHKHHSDLVLDSH